MITTDLLECEVAALDIIENWYGGRVFGFDLFIASIDRSVVRDLCDMKLLRSTLLGYEITRCGRISLDRSTRTKVSQ